MTPIGALQYPILRMRLLHRFTFARSLIRGAAVAALCVQALAQAPAQALAQTWIAQPSGTNASLRGVSAVSPAVVWASGAGGAYLRTLDGGATWQSGLVPGAADLDFRGVQALDGQTAWLMSSGPGEKSRIYMTADAGGHWSPLYTNPDAKGFFDAVAFWDARRGVVLGDPVDGQFVILTTGDGGHTWQRRKLPAALPNEGAFAASNSCLRVRIVRGEREVWFGYRRTFGRPRVSFAGRRAPLGCCRYSPSPRRPRRGNLLAMLGVAAARGGRRRGLRQASRRLGQCRGHLERAGLGRAGRAASPGLPLSGSVPPKAQGLDRGGHLRFRHLARWREQLDAVR
jgi:hypothetical protein